MIRDFGEFPKPILAALVALEDRTVNRWLEWQRDEDYFHLLHLCLMTQAENGVKRKKLWSNWHKERSSGMACSLTDIGYNIENCIPLDLDITSPAGRWRLPASMAHLDRSKK